MRLITEGIFRGLPQEHAGAILIDPPWLHVSWSPKGQTAKSPSHHYKTMELAQIAALPIRDLIKPDAWIFLWTTGPHLELAFDVASEWGVKYSGFGFTWAKETRHGKWHMGTGKTTRANMEPCLLFRLGSPKIMDKGVPELIVAPRRAHSQKPYETHKRIERFAQGPYLELFARVKRPGWRCWGLEAPDMPGSVRPRKMDLEQFFRDHPF